MITPIALTVLALLMLLPRPQLKQVIFSVTVVAACTAVGFVWPSLWPLLVGAVLLTAWPGPPSSFTWRPYVLGLAFVVITTVLLASNWGDIPEQFATHFDGRGNANGFTTKGPGVFFAQILSTVLLAVGAGLSWMLSAARGQIKTHKTAKERARFQAMMRASEQGMAWMMGVLSMLITTVGMKLALPDTVPLPAGSSGVWMVLIAVTAIFGSLGLVAYTFIAAEKAASQAPEEELPQEEKTRDFDPADYRKAGMFYYNPDDPAYFVEKAVGYGIDFNYAHWPAKVFLVVVAASLLLPVLLMTVFS